MKLSESLIERFPNFLYTIKSSHKEEKKLIKTGVTVIDDVLGGIIPTDLNIIASSTGLGKTQLSLNICTNIVMQNLSCVMFSFESYEEEIQDRYIFSLLSSQYYSENNKPLSFREWVTGHSSEDVYELEKTIVKNINNKMNNLRVRYRGRMPYSAPLFEKEIKELCTQEDIDIIIVDHLHYFDMPESKTENKALKDIIYLLRDVGLQINKPIILFAHLRKKDKGDKILIPDETEIHGSSEIPKNATNVITMSHANIRGEKNYLIPTFFRFPKLRFDEGGKKRYLFCSQFNLKNFQYEETYKIYKPKNYWTEVDPVLSQDVPRWAINAKHIGSFEANME